MQDVFDFWWIIYATIAVVIFVKLRSVLGQRTGRERPPYDPYSARDAVRPSTNDNVVALPGRIDGAGLRSPARRWPPVSMPSRARTRTSTPSTSSPAPGPPMR